MPAIVSLPALRRHVVAWQAFAPRFRRATAEELVAAIRRLSCVQLDSIATVARSHVLALGARVGAFDPDVVSTLLSEGRLVEYWAHEACLIAAEDWPLFRHRMRERRTHHWWGPVIDSDPALAEKVLDEVRRRGPLASRDFEGRGGGGMWNLKPAKRMLDALWTAGELVISGRQGFERVYDLPERVLPATVLRAREPGTVETMRELVLRAVRGRGALTARGVVDHYRFQGGVARIAPHLAALCRSGDLEEVAVADEGAPVFVPPEFDGDAEAANGAAVLLSPFDNLLWDRAFTRRLFGFDHVIEVYKQQHQRVYGYYVMPFLLGDRLVGRVDVKADRATATLLVKAFHREAGVRETTRLAEGLDRAVTRLARTLRLERVEYDGLRTERRRRSRAPLRERGATPPR